jgi:hypothetical protein
MKYTMGLSKDRNNMIRNGGEEVEEHDRKPGHGGRQGGQQFGNSEDARQQNRGLSRSRKERTKQEKKEKSFHG